MPQILTYVSSNTFDEVLMKMYPDGEAVERDIDEVERLIIQGHTVQYRFGNNSVDLTLDKLNTLVKPLFKDEPVEEVPAEDVVPNPEASFTEDLTANSMGNMTQGIIPDEFKMPEAPKSEEKKEEPKPKQEQKEETVKLPKTPEVAKNKKKEENK